MNNNSLKKMSRKHLDLKKKAQEKLKEDLDSDKVDSATIRSN